MGDEPEKVDNTCLSDKVKQYEYGIGDPGDLEFKFKYENSSATSPYRVLRKAQEDGNIKFPRNITRWNNIYMGCTSSVKLVVEE